MKATNKAAAWEMVDEIFPTDYIKNEGKSSRAGYDIYTSTADDETAYICDLGDRLEVNFSNGKSVNVWFDDDQTAEPGATEKHVSMEIRYTKLSRNTEVFVRISTGVTFNHETTFDSIRRFIADVKKIETAFKYCQKNAISCDIDLMVATYNCESGKYETVDFDAWNHSGIPDACSYPDENGLYLRPDTRYTKEEHDIFLLFSQSIVEQLAEGYI